jgi:hypothetical protein
MLLSYASFEGDMLPAVLALLKKGCHDRHQPLRVTSFTCLSSILEMILDHNPHGAAEIYKFMVFVMIENHGDAMKPLLQRTLMNLIDNHNRIPVNIIVEPFLKYAQLFN